MPIALDSVTVDEKKYAYTLFVFYFILALSSFHDLKDETKLKFALPTGKQEPIAL